MYMTEVWERGCVVKEAGKAGTGRPLSDPDEKVCY